MQINDYNQLLKLANRYLIDNKDAMEDYVKQLSSRGDARYERSANTLADYEKASFGGIVTDEDRKVFGCYTHMCEQYLDDMSEAQALYVLHSLALDLNNKKIDGQTITVSKGLIEAVNHVKDEYRQKYEAAAERADASMTVIKSFSGKNITAELERVTVSVADMEANDISEAQQYVLTEAHSRLSKAGVSADNSAYRLAEYYARFGGTADKVKLYIDMSKTDDLTVDNMDQKFALCSIGDYNMRQWAMDAFEDMFVDIYGEKKYRELTRTESDRISMLDSIFVDGVSASEKFFINNYMTYDMRCLLLMDKLLSANAVTPAGKRLNVKILERNGNDVLAPVDDEKIVSVDIKANVRAAEPATEPRLSLWGRMIRFFKNLFSGKEMSEVAVNSQITANSRAQGFNKRISFAAMSNEDAIDKIRSTAERNRYSDKLTTIKAVKNNMSVRMSAIWKDPFADDDNPRRRITNSLIDKKLSCAYKFVEPSEEYPDGIKQDLPMLGFINTMDTQISLAIAAALVTPGEGQLEFSDIGASNALSSMSPITRFALRKSAIEMNEVLAPPTLRSIAGEELTDEQLAETFKDPEMQEKYNTALLRSKYSVETFLYKVDEGLKKIGKEIRDLDMSTTEVEELQTTAKKIILFDKMVTSIQNALNDGLVREDPVFDNVKQQLQSTIDKYYDKDMVKLVDTMGDPEMTAPITANPESLCEKLAFCIAKHYEIKTSCGEYAGQRDHEETAQRAESLKSQLLESYASNPGVIRFARDIAFAHKELPDGMFCTKDNSCHLMEAYKGAEVRSVSAPRLSSVK